MIVCEWAKTGLDRFDTWSELAAECLLSEARPLWVWYRDGSGKPADGDWILTEHMRQAREDAEDARIEAAAYRRAAL